MVQLVSNELRKAKPSGHLSPKITIVKVYLPVLRLLELLAHPFVEGGEQGGGGRQQQDRHAVVAQVAAEIGQQRGRAAEDEDAREAPARGFQCDTHDGILLSSPHPFPMARASINSKLKTYPAPAPGLAAVAPWGTRRRGRRWL